MQPLQRLCQGPIALGGGVGVVVRRDCSATTPGRLKKEAGGSPFAKTKKNPSRLPNPGGRRSPSQKKKLIDSETVMGQILLLPGFNQLQASFSPQPLLFPFGCLGIRGTHRAET